MGRHFLIAKPCFAFALASALFFIACGTGGPGNTDGSGNRGVPYPAGDKTDYLPLRIATAASVQLPMKTLTQAFTDKTGIPCEIITGSSGQLSAQIKAGAPFDVFVAANLDYPAELFRDGYSDKPPETYAYGKLILWSTSEELQPSIALLDSPATRHIAIANPETAPFGLAALETLKHYRLQEKVSHKLVYGQNVLHASRFILSGAASIGFSSLSVVKSPEMEGRGEWIAIDTAAYSPIAQGIILLRRPESLQAAPNRCIAAQQFYDFMFSENAGAIMTKFGYIITSRK